MSKLTNAQLVAQLEAAHVSYQALEAKYESTQAQLTESRIEHSRCAALLEDALNEVVRIRGTKQPTAQRWVRRAPTPEQLAAHDEYARRLIAAREEAARSGRTVRVG